MLDRWPVLNTLVKIKATKVACIAYAQGPRAQPSLPASLPLGPFLLLWVHLPAQAMEEDGPGGEQALRKHGSPFLPRCCGFNTLTFCRKASY